MFRTTIPMLALLTVFSNTPPVVLAQGGGGMGGFGSTPAQNEQGSYGYPQMVNAWSYTPTPESERVLGYISIDGSAELRVKPTEIRLVMAVTSLAESAEDCQSQNEEQVAAVRRQWQELNIPDEKIVEDFIAVLPTYRWDPEERKGTKILVEHRDGFRMQTNLHLAVPTEEQAMAAIRRAFVEGVSDIITFDYWHPELNDKKHEARRSAIAAAKEKADTLLAVFDERPPVVNVQDNTYVTFPRRHYRTFTNALEETPDWRNWGSLPRLHAFRPKLTFYDTLQTQVDVGREELAMHPMISIVSQVRLYYESPGRQQDSDEK